MQSNLHKLAFAADAPPLIVGWDTDVAVVVPANEGCDIAAKVRRFCTDIGPKRPAAAAAWRFATVDCCVGVVSVWACNPAQKKKVHLKF